MNPAVQISAISPRTWLALNACSQEGKGLISILVKRTYRFDPRGHAVPEPEQLPLRLNPEYDDTDDGYGEANRNQRVLLADLEIYPFKPMTDVIVSGHAYSHGRRAIDAMVTVGDRAHHLRIMGDRRAAMSATGHIVFSEPEPFEKMPLRYDRAYGGCDPEAEKRYPSPLRDLIPNLPPGTDVRGYSPGLYPRNRHGRGYLLTGTAQAIEQVALPNIENPRELLDPNTLLVRDPFSWWRQPLPAGTTWMHHGYFARLAYWGARPFWRPLDDALPEFTRGLVPRAVRDIVLGQSHPLIFHMQNGASLGLKVPHLRSGVTIALTNLHPHVAQASIRVPPAPVITVRTRWRGAERADIVLHHIEIHPDTGTFTVVWRGTVEAKRPLIPQELDALPHFTEWKS